jgi:hypothetical protein
MTDIALTDLTNGTNTDNGTGVFDLLMNSVELRIQKQFAEQRITSDDYAMIYLGALQSIMAESIKFLLAEQSAGLEADLIQQKINSEIKNNENGGVIDLQKADIEAGTAIKAQQTLTEKENTILVREKGESEVLANMPNGLIEKQVAKTDNEGKLLTQRSLTEVQQTAKTAAERELLDQKTRTEEAQIKDIVQGSAVMGTVAKKNNLFEAQTQGFARDAEQKMAKIMADTWNVAKTADPTGVSGNASNRLRDSDIGQVITKAKAGIGA